MDDFTKEIVTALLKLSDEQLDKYAKLKLERFLGIDKIDQPGYLLCIIDDLVHCSLSSEFEIKVLNEVYQRIKNEKVK